MSTRRIGFASLVLLVALLGPASLAMPGSAYPQDDSTIVEEIALARDDFEQGRFYACSKALRALLDEVPEHVGARLLLLQSEAASGRYDEADQLDAALATLANQDRDVSLVRAQYALARGRIADAERIVAPLLGSEAPDLDAAYIHARTLSARGAREPLRAFVSSIVERVPVSRSDVERQFGLGRLLALSGELERAQELCVYAEKAARDAGTNSSAILLQIGDLERMALSLDGKEIPRAFETYREVLEQNPGSVAARVGRAWMHLYVNASVLAEKEIDDALAINPSDPDALVVRAWIDVTDARHSDALKELDRALAVDPSHKKARAVRAAALHLLRRVDEFAAEEKLVLELDPGYGEFYTTVGDALSRVYRFEEAVPFHRRAVELDPEAPLAPISLGRDLCFCGLEAEGNAALEQSRATHPFAHPWRENMLIVLEKLREQFVDVTSENFLMRMHIDENAILTPLLRSALESDLVELEAKYGWKIERDVLVEMFPQMADFSVRSVGLVGVGAVGVCFGHFVTLVSPRSEARWTFVWRRTALHELTHVITLGRSKKRVPRWLTEGLSVYEERCEKVSWYRDQIAELNDAVANDDLLKLRSFNAAFRGPRIGFGYYQGGLFCEFVDRVHGFDRILAMLDAYAEDLETPAVIEKVFGKDCEALDAEFLAWVKSTVLKDVRVQPVFGAEMRRKLRDRARKEPGNADVLADLAWAYSAGGKEVDADVQLGALREIAPDHPSALRLLARRALSKGRKDTAREYLEKVFTSGAIEYYSALELAGLRFDAGDAEGGEAALRAAYACFRDDPNPSSASARLVEYLVSEGREDEARKIRVQRIELIEAAIEPRLDHADYLLSIGEVDAALRFVNEAEDIDPFLRRLHVTRAKAERANKDAVSAVASLRRALLVDPRFEQAYSPPRSAEERASFEAEEQRQRVELLVEIASIELEMGDVTSARQDFERAREIAPDSQAVLDLAERFPK